MSFYFNHLTLTDASRESINDYFIEIAKLREVIRTEENELLFSSDFWSLPVFETSLSQYLYSLDKNEVTIVIINAVENGPHFDLIQEEQNDLKIEPSIPSNDFARKLLLTCWNDEQEKILSLSREEILVQRQYFITHDITNKNLNIRNIIGNEEILNYYESECQFKNIDSVFTKIKEGTENIVILLEAKKSARNHDFKSRYEDVYNSIIALENVELECLLQGVNDEVRKEKFYEEVGLRISSESYRTMNRYRDDRQITIPGKGKKIFEWHIKIGSNTRIHYYIDKESGKIYIGHCAEHLPI